MPLTPENAQTMRQIMAALLEIDPERVTGEANFFRDLGGSFDHLKPLRLKTEAAFDVDITAITDEVNARTGMNAGGQVTKKSLKAIGDYLGLKFEKKIYTFTDLFSVAFIEAITAKAIEHRQGKHEGAAPVDKPAVRFGPFSRAAEVRKIVGRILNIPADRLSADTDLGHMDGLLLAAIFCELDASWGISMARAVEDILAASRLDAKGSLTRASRRKLAELLPGVKFPATGKVDLSFLNRLGALEAIVERDATTEPKASHQPIFRLPAGLAWTAESSQPLLSLQQTLGDRMTQRVLAKCCRIANTAHTPWSSLAEQCIEAIERFATTGKGKKDLKELSRDVKDWEHEGVPLLRALAEGLKVEVPNDLLVSAAKVMAVAENLDQAQAVKRVQEVATGVASEEPPRAGGANAGKGKKKPLLAQLPKSAQRELPEVMQRCGNRTLREYIAWEWNFEQQMNPERRTRFLQGLQDGRGGLTFEQRLMGTRFSHVYSSLADLAVARRFCLEDPAEILIGLSLAGRIGWMEQGLKGRSFDDPLLGALAVGDWAVADRYVETLPVWDPNSDIDFDLRSDGVVSVLRRDYARLETALDRDIDRSHIAWYQAMIDFFRGVIEDDPSQTIAALQRFFEAMNRLRDKLQMEFAISTTTHGFYRLAESVSPELVAGFDISQKFPWDAEVHACVSRGERPWEDFDLSDISPELHQAVTTLSRPVWWT